MRQTTILTGIISSDMVLKRTNTYVMIGVVYVTNKATLTIEAGTVIRGDKQTCGTLVITKGSKIMAEGNETAPIILPNTFYQENQAIGAELSFWRCLNKIGGIALDFNLKPEVSYYGGQMKRIIQEF
jgi:hypothetical protein